MDESLSAATPLETSPENPTKKPESTAIAGGLAADQFEVNGVFVLVLKNGTRHGATAYWLADGYLEYVGRDGARSHIPLEALDLEKTVAANSPRGLPFILRSAPAEDR